MLMLCHFSCFLDVVVHAVLHSLISNLICIDLTTNHVIHIQPFPLLFDEEWKFSTEDKVRPRFVGSFR